MSKDISDYVLSRVASPGSQILPNIRHSKMSDADLVNKMVGHLVPKAHGCFLYVKLILDLLERGNLVIKSASFKVRMSNQQIFCFVM